MKKEIINLTPHDVNIVREGKVIATIPASGAVARLATDTAICGGVEVNGFTIPLTKTIFGRVENLPEEKEDTILIVSQLIKNSPECQNRTDLVVPTEMVRDDDNNIIGCRSLGI